MSPMDDPFQGEPGEPTDEDFFDFAVWTESNEIEMEDGEDEICDHDEHKEVVSIQEIRGANAMGIGGQYGTAEALIGCTKCGKARPVERVDKDRNPFDLGL